ncbi:hypothetical protein [Nonomuraea bangladeshensis]|uniref:hypothetical protein n=1 Tax=Nonomuraea bangladeshensis TaxID=404385 RepID=UPI003C2B34FE
MPPEPNPGPAATFPTGRGPAAWSRTGVPSPNPTSSVTAGCGTIRIVRRSGMRNPAMVTPATPLGRDGQATPHAAAPCTKVRTLRCQVSMPAQEAGNIRPPLLTGRDHLEELRSAELLLSFT